MAYKKYSTFEESFEANAYEKKEINVFVNGFFTESKSMFVELDWGLKDILSSASQRLGIPTAKRLFNADGVEIDDVMMIIDNDMLFVSAGEDFVSKPTDSHSSRLKSTDSTGKVNTVDDGAQSSNLSSSDGINDKYAAKGDNLPPVIGNYKVSTFLGRGGFGVVRVGQHQLTDEKIALKFINKSDILSIAAAERTMTEIQCLTTLKHSNIILLNEYIETQKHVVLMFELMLGGDLSSHMKAMYLEMAKEQARSDDEAPKDLMGADADNLHEAAPLSGMAALTEEEAKTVFFQVISAVAYAHNHHICHRDLKLENILLKNKKSISVVKVADFGLSDFYRPGSTRRSNCGTLAFLAPEGFKNTSNAGPPLDVWSLGVILFAMLFGRLPFDESTDARRDFGNDKESVLSPGTVGGVDGALLAGGRYDLVERDRDNIRREEGRPLYNNKATAAEKTRKRSHGGQGHVVAETEEEEKPKKKALRPEQIIRQKILRCQYTFDSPYSISPGGGPSSSVSLEAKDLIKRMLVVEPEERASIPEIFSHVWNHSGAGNHHNHTTPRMSGKRNQGSFRKRTDSMNTTDSDPDSTEGAGALNERNENLPTPAPSPLIPKQKALHPSNSLHLAPLTRQESSVENDVHNYRKNGDVRGDGTSSNIPKQDRVEILGSGNLNFGALAIDDDFRVNKNEKTRSAHNSGKSTESGSRRSRGGRTSDDSIKVGDESDGPPPSFTRNSSLSSHERENEAGGSLASTRRNSRTVGSLSPDSGIIDALEEAVQGSSQKTDKSDHFEKVNSGTPVSVLDTTLTNSIPRAQGLVNNIAAAGASILLGGNVLSPQTSSSPGELLTTETPQEGMLVPLRRKPSRCDSDDDDARPVRDALSRAMSNSAGPASASTAAHSKWT